MSFTSIYFVIFVLMTGFVYYLFPKKFRFVVLAIANTVFYFILSKWMIVLLALITLISYAGGRFAKKKNVTAISVISLVGFLAIFKYLNFIEKIITDIVPALGGLLSEKVLAVLVPIGLSFYVFEAISYVVDCKKDEANTEKNILLLYTYLSLFMTVSSGPIERSNRIICQLRNPDTPEYDHVRKALLLILWGAMLKMVMANRLDIFVTYVYGNLGKVSGTITRLATIFYSFEIYCDFAGYSCIAIGVGQLLGIQICDNFKSPYLSKSIAEFWRRWHISLSQWLRDYVYIPLGGNRKGQKRKLVNLFIVFLISGIWHGGTWAFVVWGVLHGLYQIAGIVLTPLREKVSSKLDLQNNEQLYSVIKVLFTFFLVNFAWIFFKADSFTHAFEIIKGCTKISPWALFDGSIYAAGLGKADILVLFACLIVLIYTDIANYRDISIREKLLKQPLVLRWLVYIFAIIFVIFCGVWGPGYDAGNFIYMGF